MALDPYKRGLRRSQRITNSRWKRFSRVPYIIGACGLIAMIGLVYKLGEAGINQFIAWHAQ